MTLGVGVFLLLVGAILAFAVTGDVNGLDLQAVGWIGMLVGVIAIALSLTVARQRWNTSHTEVVERRDVGGVVPPATSARTTTDYRSAPPL